jgi:hypothetical protein
LRIAQELFPVFVSSVDGLSLPEIARQSGLSLDDLIASMPVADALFVIASLRHTEVSDELYFKSDCPACGANNDDNPKKKLFHSIGGMDICRWIPNREPVVKIQLKERIISLYPLQLVDMADFWREPLPMDMKYLLYCTESISGLFDRENDGRLTLDLYEKIVSTPAERNVWYQAVEELGRIGPSLELGNECVKCRHEWSSSLPPEDLPEFFIDLLITPTESELLDMAFFLVFGEQAPVKSIAEVDEMPVRHRDEYIRKLSETYQKQQEDMKKNSKKGGSSTRTTEYL